MLKRSVVGIMAALCIAGSAAADVVCPDSSYCVVTFGQTYSQAWRNGQPYDYVTVSADGMGETFAGFGIAIRVYLKNCQGDPLVGIPAQEIILFNSGLCICPGGNISDAGTDTNGCAMFTGTLRAGGCVQGLDVFADGQFICTAAVNINSTDHVPASPCFTDGADLSGLAAVLGSVPLYNICKDYNESGQPTVNGGDLSFFAQRLGSNCI